MKTTADVMRDMDAEHAAEKRDLEDGHTASKGFVRAMCEAGLVDDVAPNGPVVPIPPPTEITCVGCDASLPVTHDTAATVCPHCGWSVFRVRCG